MIIVVVGPTAVGKSTLAIELAKHYDTEVISGDSVQVYKHLNVGTAKITDDEADGVPHRMLDILEPGEAFSVAQYQRLVRGHIEDLNRQGKQPIIAGGTGFYVRAVLHDYDFTGAHRPKRFDEKHAHLKNKELHALLEKKDAKSAAAIHPNNRTRIIQALYRAESTTPRSEQHDAKKPLYPYIMIGLDMERKTLYERINNRVDDMIDKGLVDEVESLYLLYGDAPAFDAIGYKEIIGHLKGYYPLETAIDLIKTNTRRYAKRQLTFFKNQFDCIWLTVNPDRFEDTVDEAIRLIDETKKEKP